MNEVNVPEEIKEKIKNKTLKLEDVINYIDELQEIKVDNYMESNIIVDFFKNNYEPGELQELIKKHKDVFSHIKETKQYDEFGQYLKKRKDIKTSFQVAVKNYFLNHGLPPHFKILRGSKTIYNPPEWLSSMNFEYKEFIRSIDELKNYENLFILYNEQRNVIDMLGVENIIKFDEETNFFTHKSTAWNRNLEMLEAVARFFSLNHEFSLKKAGIDFKSGSMTYEKFKKEFASLMDYMRKNNVFVTYPNYDWMEGDFRNNHPEIFIKNDAPKELREAFYRNAITPKLLHNHKEYIPYLIDKNLTNTIVANISLSNEKEDSNFIEEYAKRYGNEKLLNLISDYGEILDEIIIDNKNNEINNEETINNNIIKAIYKKIINTKIDYSYIENIKEKHPELFFDSHLIKNIPEEEIKRIKNAFYKRELTYDDIRKYPELIKILKDKNLYIPFGIKDATHANGRIYIDGFYSHSAKPTYSDLELLEVYGNEKFLELCKKYGRYMEGVGNLLDEETTIKNGKYYDTNEKELSFEDISKKIEEIIIKECLNGSIRYYPEDAPNFIKESHPELFLDEDVPEELKNYFYNYDNRYQMSFHTLSLHKEWMPYLKDKSLKSALLKNGFLKYAYFQAIDLFGEKDIVKLGMTRAETVEEMMNADQVELMKRWYDKTGRIFIPDYVVMQNFDINEADKFLTSGSLWSRLMRIKDFARMPEGRDAMLKLAYSFGVFDQDQRGFKKLEELLTDIPKQLKPFSGNTLKRIDERIDSCTQRKLSKKESQDECYEKMLKSAKEHKFNDIFNNKTLFKLLVALKEENVNIDYSKPLFHQLYKEKEDGTFQLTINKQSYPKTVRIMRKMLQKFVNIPILTPNKAHTLFGGFELEYDAEFREFLLDNIEEIVGNPSHAVLIPSIQKQFHDIKAANSNRKLTLDLAISFVQTNRYTNVNIGNEKVAEISSIAGYSQRDFDTLQEIYNYGKQRTFSSIPRIENSKEGYTYEILRLDDPLALAIGTLTNCCQRLNDCAEVCMEHSMVSEHGRTFVVRDKDGNIVAQSWVWRNKDVICFDNIEIPKKAFARAAKDDPKKGKKRLTEEIYRVYKKAAQELIVEDEKIYKKLFEEGKITEEQYNGLRLGKVTAGLGYNDIAETLEENTEKDKDLVSRPLPFKAPVPLKRGLYTSDSITQQVLEEREDRKEYEGDTPPVHSDTYIEYDDSNFSEKQLLTLEKLEIITKDHPNFLETSTGKNAEEGHIVSKLLSNYGLNPKTGRIIMNPNFAIIYDDNNDKVKIGELLYNTKVNNENQKLDISEEVTMQIKMALDQIAKEKELDITELKDYQKEMIKKTLGIDEKIDIERGGHHAR